MKNIIEYKGYLGSVEYSDEDEVFFGEVLFINDVITFEGTDVKSLKEGFHYMVDDYLEMCKRVNKKPDKPFSGSFNVRTGSDLHQKAAIFAETHNKSLNKVVTEALEKYIA
ncbi:MAG: antitoxin HicB [Candidatus Melainabacteria bacterium GWA2_34_9]|nr:MAG: antitoxin HicB [Candidatus Melainabacteria bacterium GWA2_34_9]